MRQREIWSALALLGTGTVTGIATAIVAFGVAMRVNSSLSDAWVGFFGSVAGGLVGGLLAIAAGFLAWTAAQQQIETQREALKFGNMEHDARAKNVINRIKSEIQRVTAQVRVAQNADIKDPYDENNMGFIQDNSKIDSIDVHNDPDFWRVDHSITEIITELNASIVMYSVAKKDNNAYRTRMNLRDIRKNAARLHRSINIESA